MAPTFLSSTTTSTQTFLSKPASNQTECFPPKTFFISDDHLATQSDRLQTGKDIINSFRKDGVVNISISGLCSSNVLSKAFMSQKKFFDMPSSFKQTCFNEFSYGGYVYSGEEETAGKKDAAEIFTITPDISVNDCKFQSGIPCHGPMPWPSQIFEENMSPYMKTMNAIGTRVVRLIALGLGMEEDKFDALTEDSWGHMRVLKYCEKSKSLLKGTGSHTDYGMIVLLAQDRVGGLWVRPPGNDERNDNWKRSTAGNFDESGDADGWKFVTPQPNVLTCFPGDMLQFITNRRILSTPHKVELAHEIRYALAYFHEPSFGAVIQKAGSAEKIHYGEHFTNMFLRCYPDKPVSKRIKKYMLQNNLIQSITGTYTF